MVKRINCTRMVKIIDFDNIFVKQKNTTVKNYLEDLPRIIGKM